MTKHFLFTPFCSASLIPISQTGEAQKSSNELPGKRRGRKMIP